MVESKAVAILTACWSEAVRNSTGQSPPNCLDGLTQFEGAIHVEATQICLYIMGSTFLHALMLVFLTRAVIVSQVPMSAMETYIIAPASLSVHETPRSQHHVADVRSEPRTQKMKGSLPDRKQNLSTATSDRTLHHDRSGKSKIPALKQVAAAAGTTETDTVIAARHVALAKTHVPTGSGESIQTAIQTNGTETIRDMSLGDAGAPRFIHREMPIYPFIARKLGKEGKVVLRLKS